MRAVGKDAIPRPGFRDSSAPWDEYLTVGEVASILKVSPKRVRNMMSSGSFRAGMDFFRRPGIGPRFVRSRLEAWLRDSDRASDEPIPMARSCAPQRAGGRLG